MACICDVQTGYAVSVFEKRLAEKPVAGIAKRTYTMVLNSRGIFPIKEVGAALPCIDQSATPFAGAFMGTY
eukprot:gene8312-1586_t